MTDVLMNIMAVAKEKNFEVKVGNILTSDTFYTDDSKDNDLWKRMQVLAVEMETAALYYNAARLGKKALAILTISDHLYSKKELTAQERQFGFRQMMELALETSVQ